MIEEKSTKREKSEKLSEINLDKIWYFSFLFFVVFVGLSIIWVDFSWVNQIPIEQTAEAKIILDQFNYSNGDKMEIQIENPFLDRICFSSCYPYYLQKKQGGVWHNYNYAGCPWENEVENCIEPKQAKAFQISLTRAISGLHRLSLPVCQDCIEKKQFKITDTFYSPEFNVR